MRRVPLILAAAMTFVIAAVAAGCGGGGGGGERLSKSEFIAKADAICTKARSDQPEPPADIANVDPTASTTTDEQLNEFGGYIEDVVKNFRGEIGDLRDLNPPADLEDRWDSALATLEEAVNEVDEAGEAARNGDREKFKAKLEESQKHNDDANKLVKGVGLKVCGSS